MGRMDTDREKERRSKEIPISVTQSRAEGKGGLEELKRGGERPKKKGNFIWARLSMLGT